LVGATPTRDSDVMNQASRAGVEDGNRLAVDDV
jgi:hypothetical protein